MPCFSNPFFNFLSPVQIKQPISRANATNGASNSSIPLTSVIAFVQEFGPIPSKSNLFLIGLIVSKIQGHLPKGLKWNTAFDDVFKFFQYKTRSKESEV